jgi:hypothetical protein
MAMVGVVIGSKTDEPIIKPALDLLEKLGISYEFAILSAHRKPEQVRKSLLLPRELPLTYQALWLVGLLYPSSEYPCRPVS